MRWFRRKRRHIPLSPDEVLVEAHYLTTASDESRYRAAHPLSPLVPYVLMLVTTAASVVALLVAGRLQVGEAAHWRAVAASNLADAERIAPPRGVIIDREGREIAGNAPASPFPLRTYRYPFALAHLIGYVRPPQRDAQGRWYRTAYEGVVGVEAAYDDVLRGEEGVRISVRDARGVLVEQRELKPPREAPPLALTVDAALSLALYHAIEQTAQEHGYQGGSGVILSLPTGALLAAVSYPSFDPRPFGNAASTTEAARELARSRSALFPRALRGTYMPGSTFKPFVAVSALSRGIITPETTIVSSGRLVVPNLYDPQRPTVYHDWGPPAYGANNLSRALAFSSNVYFMTVAGGSPGTAVPRGVGIAALAQDLAQFGFSEPFSVAGYRVPAGTIPTPAWKEQVFGEPWRLGDTYLTAIGQFGVRVTPIALARAVAGIATGKLPSVCVTENECATAHARSLPFAPEHLIAVRRGMVRAVLEGTARGLALPGIQVAAKTGTAEVGEDAINSLVIGFVPANRPRYAFAVVMERGPRHTTIGGVYVMHHILRWMVQHGLLQQEDGEVR